MDEAIVDKVAARVLALMSGLPIDTGRRSVVVVFSGAACGFAAGREAVARLVHSPHELTVMMTPSARHLFGEEPLRRVGVPAIVDLEPCSDVCAFVRRADIVLVPTLTMSLAARLALGLTDSPAATLLLGALLAGKPVLAVRDGADPAGKRGEALGAVPGGSTALWRLFAERLETLEGFGMELRVEGSFLFALERLLITPPGRRLAPTPAPAAALPSEGRRSAIITAGEIQMLTPGSRLAIDRGRRLTAQASDVATRLGLKLDFA